MALNPLNTDAVGILGLQIVHTGEFERGAAIVRRAMELNPNHAGWMHFAPLWEHFHKGEYEQALECANRVDVPGLFWPFLVVASACGHLGRRAEAESAVRDLLALDPEFAAHARSNVGTWHFASGLMEPDTGWAAQGRARDFRDRRTARLRGAIGTVRRRESARVGHGLGTGPGRGRVLGRGDAVQYGGADASLTALAEGLTEEIVTGLSRFSYLRVIARNATVAGAFPARSSAPAMSWREACARPERGCALAVQLVDTASGAHLWAETYDRAFVPEEIFDAAGRARSPHRLHGRRHARRLAAQHERGRCD